MIRALVCLGLEESKAAAQIPTNQEEQGVELAFGFVPIFNKNGLGTS